VLPQWLYPGENDGKQLAELVDVFASPNFTGASVLQTATDYLTGNATFDDKKRHISRDRHRR